MEEGTKRMSKWDNTQHLSKIRQSVFSKFTLNIAGNKIFQNKEYLYSLL